MGCEARLDSPEGLQALERSLAKGSLAKASSAGCLEAYLESWSHPWLADWAAHAGCTNPHDPALSPDDRTGHFDHGPYALASQSGPAFETPFEAERGRVYFVEWKSWVKCVEIVGQVERQVDRFLSQKNSWRPAWATKIARVFAGIRHGFACLEDDQVSGEERALAVEEARQAFDTLDGQLGTALLEWSSWSCDERVVLSCQFARVRALRKVLPGACTRG